MTTFLQNWRYTRIPQINLTLLIWLLAVLASPVARAQGTVDFHNTSTTQITTNNIYTLASGPTVGAGNYVMGLYIGPFGSSANTFTLAGTATNISLPGLFGTTGNLISTPAPGTQLSFQVRAWSRFAGSTYEQAFAYASSFSLPEAYLGQSTIGFFTAPSSGSIILFGSGPGQVGGFVMQPLVAPEPSTIALGAFGALMILLMARWKRQDARR